MTQQATTNPEQAQPGPCQDCARLSAPDAKTVTLLSGAVVCNYCDRWREECLNRQKEADFVLRLGTREARRSHLAYLERQHGAEYRRRLDVVILETWESRKRSARSGNAYA